MLHAADVPITKKKGSDISDINAKFGAQHTVTGALGLIFAAFFARSVDQMRAVILWTLYMTLTFVHIFANTRCMRLISFDSCNNARINLLLSSFFVEYFDNASGLHSEVPRLPTPAAIAKIEPLFFGAPGKYKRPPTDIPIRFGVAFDEFYEIADESFALTKDGVGIWRNNSENYIIGSGWKEAKGLSIVVSFLSHATPIDETKAYFHATLLGTQLQKQFGKRKDDSPNAAALLNVERETREVLTPAWEAFKTCSFAAGWDLTKTELQTEGYGVEVIGC